MISIFDLFKIGIGPSSSHTVGPMRSARDFVASIESLEDVDSLEAQLYGSLALTGRGHGTDKAILLGLSGEFPDSVNPDHIAPLCQAAKTDKRISLLGKHTINFDPQTQINYFQQEVQPYHTNALRFTAYDKQKRILRTDTYFSIGGGFIEKESDLLQQKPVEEIQVPYPFNSAKELIAHCKQNNKRIYEIMLANECVRHSEAETKQRLLAIAQAMYDCIQRGCESKDKELEGIKVKRRAPQLYQKLMQEQQYTRQEEALNWANLYAMAVGEENAAGSRIVTAPTNGASGIIPAVLKFYHERYGHYDEIKTIEFLLTAGAIGMLYKQNASISGAEVGCQGEVGVACSMAAPALTAVSSGTTEQIENAAEIAMEHNLGLTCDPVGGLVQIPCIERNAMGAVKAINATELALAGDGEHYVCLDTVIKTMYEIGKNMDRIYKETSLGGLAVNVPNC